MPMTVLLWVNMLRYRVTVEHTFAYLKSFDILGGTFRGHLFSSSGSAVEFLADVVTVLMNTASLHMTLIPHRIHRELDGVPLMRPG